MTRLVAILVGTPLTVLMWLLALLVLGTAYEYGSQNEPLVNAFVWLFGLTILGGAVTATVVWVGHVFGKGLD